MFTRQDLPLHISSSEIDLYAGDTIITSSADCNSMVRLKESLNTSVSDVFNWALANRLPLNKEKTTGPISEGKATLDQKKIITLR